MEKKKKQRDHFIPQMYLKRFYDSKENLHIYSKSEDKYFLSNTKHMFWERDWDLLKYYSQKSKNKQNIQVLYDILKDIEPKVPILLDKLSDQYKKLSNEERFTLSTWFAIIQLLNPRNIKNSVNRYANLVKNFTEMLYNNGSFDNIRNTNLIKDIIERENISFKDLFDVSVDRDYIRCFNFDIVNYITFVFYMSNWSVFLNTRQREKFLTCDFPMHFINQDNKITVHPKGIALNPQTYLYINPLTLDEAKNLKIKIKTDSNYKNFISGKTLFRSTSSIEYIKFFNLHTIYNADKFIISSYYDKKLEDFINKNKKYSTKSIQTNIPTQDGILTISTLKNIENNI